MSADDFQQQIVQALSATASSQTSELRAGTLAMEKIAKSCFSSRTPFAGRRKVKFDATTLSFPWNSSRTPTSFLIETTLEIVTNLICLYTKASEFLMSNSGTPGLTPFLMDLIADASLGLEIRLPAATTFYGLIARTWTVDVRLTHSDYRKGGAIRRPLCELLSVIFPPLHSRSALLLRHSNVHVAFFDLFPCSLTPFASPVGALGQFLYLKCLPKGLALRAHPRRGQERHQGSFGYHHA